MSYCNRASCLAHHRPVYFNLQDRAWVHTDGWPCGPAPGSAAAVLMAELAARAEHQAAEPAEPARHYCGTSALPHQPGPECSDFASPAPAAERPYQVGDVWDRHRDRRQADAAELAADPAAVYAAVTLDAIARAGDLWYAVYAAGRYLAEHPRPGRGSDQ
jgi:hypothetical protein